MATNYPTDFDDLIEPDYTKKMNQSDPKHSEDHQAVRDAVKALQTKAGIDGDTNPDSLDKRISDLESAPPPPTTTSAYTWMSRTYLQTGVGRRFYADRDGTISGVYAWATDSAPVTNLTYDVLKNGTSIFSTQPTIDTGNFLGDTVVPTVTSFVTGDKLEVELVSLGGIIEGKIGVCIKFDGV